MMGLQGFHIGDPYQGTIGSTLNVYPWPVGLLFKVFGSYFTYLRGPGRASSIQVTQAFGPGAHKQESVLGNLIL